MTHARQKIGGQNSRARENGGLQRPGSGSSFFSSALYTEETTPSSLSIRVGSFVDTAEVSMSTLFCANRNSVGLHAWAPICVQHWEMTNPTHARRRCWVWVLAGVAPSHNGDKPYNPIKFYTPNRAFCGYLCDNWSIFVC